MLLYSAVFAGILTAVIIGVANLTKKRVPLFFKLILLGLVTLGLGRLYEIVQTLLFNALYSSFDIGKFSMIGGALFYFTAYYGAMDHVLDDKRSENAKYRRLSLLCPLAVLAVFTAFFILNGINFTEHASSFAVCIAGLPALYYCFKYVIFPVDEMEMIKKLRLFNLFTIFSIILTDSEVLCIILYSATGSNVYAAVWIAGGFALALVYIFQMIFLVRGYKRWTV